jgi:hypothetical protein
MPFVNNQYYGWASSSTFFAFLLYQTLDLDWRLFSPIEHPLGNVIKFVSLSLACALPRLYIDTVSLYPHSQYLLKSKDGAVCVALLYIWIDTFPSRVLQLLMHFFVMTQGPDVRTIAGLEHVTVSLLAWEFGLPLAVAMLFCSIMDVFVHQPLRRFWRGAVQTDLPRQMRMSLTWCAAIYLSSLALQRSSPHYYYRIMFWATRSVAAILACAIIIMKYFSDPLKNTATRVDDSGKLVYKKLPSEHSFRLLRILSSTRLDDPLRCELLEVLSTSDATYQAVSYRWDTSLEKTSNITVNGQNLRVYPNVEIILRNLRSAYWNQLVWMDQLCIDQENTTEKSAQVTLMGQIYESCERVMICLPVPNVAACGYWAGAFDIRLSPEQKEVALAHDLVQMLKSSKMLQDYIPGSREGDILSLASLEHWSSLGKLLDNPWFHRIWVVQEIGLASKADILYGHAPLDWDDFVSAMAVLARTDLRRFPELLPSTTLDPERDVSAIENTLIMEGMRKKADRLSLLDTLILCQRFQSTEKVDKIFALLGVSSQQDPLVRMTNVDYTSASTTVFIEVARALLKDAAANQLYRILRFAGVGPEKSPDMPSWVPDWSIRVATSNLDHRKIAMDFSAASSRNNSARFEDFTFEGADRCALVLTGYNVDRVNLLVDLSEIPDVSSSATPFIDALAASQHAEQPYFTQQPLEEVFWRTILADTHPLHRPAPGAYWQHWKSIFTRSDTLRAMKRSDRQEEELRSLYRTLRYSSSADLIFTHLLATDLSKHRGTRGSTFSGVLNRSHDYSFEHDPRASQGRQFCITDKGYMALVPKHTKKGDCVVILHGAKTPHVLRECDRLLIHGCGDGEVRCYQLIGEAYVHGLMHDNEDTLENCIEKEFYVV